MSLFEIVDLLKKNLRILVVCSLVGLMVGGIFLLVQKPSYSAKATVYVAIDLSDSDAKSTNTVGVINSASQLALQKSKSYISLFTDKSTALYVKDKLKLEDSVGSLASSISAASTKDAPSIQISASANDPELAQKIVDTATEAVSTRVQDLEGKTSPIHLKVLSAASLSTPTRSPNVFRVLVLSLFSGLLLGLVGAAVSSQVDKRLRRPSEVEQAIDRPILARIPDTDALSDYDNSSGEVFEYVRKIRTALNYVAVDQHINSLLFTSARAGEGKSSLAVAVGKVIAMSERNVLVIDADLRYPTLAERFGISTKVGLTHVLAGTVSIDDVIQASSTENLFLLPAGDNVPNPSELLGSRKMRELISELEKKYFVIIDGPPTLPVTDSVVLARMVGAVLVVVGMGMVRADELNQIIDTLEKAGGELAGLALNKVNPGDMPPGEYGNKYVSNF